MHVVITGGNRGIGAGLATAYSARGDTVTATARDGTPGLAPLDVADPNSQTAFAQSLDGQAVDLLICNAGVFLDRGQDLAGGFAPDLWADSFAVNVTGVFLTVQNLLPSLRAGQNAKVAIISSQMGAHSKAKGRDFIYRASKAAALNLGINLSHALKDDEISVGIYHPGWVITDMGGAAADINVDQAVDGLMREFDALTLETTGCFRTWDARDHPY